MDYPFDSLDMSELGWSASWQSALDELGSDRFEPARVAEEHRERYVVWSRHGELDARLSGRLRHDTVDREGFPAVGDWVAVEARPEERAATIRHVLPRRTALVRRDADRKTLAQVLATNLDTVFVVTSPNRDFNPRRIERTLAIVWESGARPVLIINKTDLCPEIEPFRERAHAAAAGVAVECVSALTGDGVGALDPHLQARQTVALVGSSGVGKSTLTNRLVGHDVLAVREIRADDDRGRHTTTHRQLIRLPGGAYLIDTPGLRTVGLWDSGEGLAETFGDIEEISRGCRFRDCSHRDEPGCAVRQALGDGTLDPGRYNGYLKLLRELAYVERQQNVRARIAEQKRWKQIHKEARRRYRERGHYKE